MITTTSETSIARSRTYTILAVVSPIAVWLGLLGPAWAYVPADDTTGTASSEMNFAALAAVNSESANSIQAAYFTWGAWLFAAVTTVLAVLAVRVGGRALGGVCVLAGLVQVVVTVLAMKGSLSWGTLIGGFENTRAGAALVFIGFLSLVALGALALRGATANSRARASSYESFAAATA